MVSQSLAVVSLYTATTTIFILKSHQSDIYYPTCSVDKCTQLSNSLLHKFFKKYDTQRNYIAKIRSGSGLQGILAPVGTG
jgi:hypothetical protein